MIRNINNKTDKNDKHKHLGFWIFSPHTFFKKVVLLFIYIFSFLVIQGIKASFYPLLNIQKEDDLNTFPLNPNFFDLTEAGRNYHIVPLFLTITSHIPSFTSVG